MTFTDIEIRKITTEGACHFRVIIYNIEYSESGGETRTIRDIYAADTYQTAVNLLPEFLNPNITNKTDLPPRQTIEKLTVASTPEFVELCHDISNNPNEIHQLWWKESDSF